MPSCSISIETAWRLRDGLTSSLRELLQRLILEQLIGDDPLQLRVLSLERFQPLRVLRLQARPTAPALQHPPAMQRLLRHLQLLSGHGNLPALPKQSVSLTQLPDDLLRRIAAGVVSGSSLRLSPVLNSGR
jgi:hypothetical protein